MIKFYRGRGCRQSHGNPGAARVRLDPRNVCASIAVEITERPLGQDRCHKWSPRAGRRTPLDVDHAERGNQTDGEHANASASGHRQPQVNPLDDRNYLPIMPTFIELSQPIFRPECSSVTKYESYLPSRVRSSLRAPRAPLTRFSSQLPSACARYSSFERSKGGAHQARTEPG